MAIHKEPEAGTINLQCDGCGTDHDEYTAGDRREFDRMISEAKVAGWKIEFVSGAWDHYCPDCKEPGDVVARTRRLFGL